MNKSEASELLTFASAFDQRTIGKADVEAWSIAMTRAHVPLDESVRDAIVEYYTSTGPREEGDTGRRFIQPHHVVAIRARIRNERIERLPQPCPNDVPGVSERDELLAIRGAIANGLITTKAQLAAYERWGGSLHLERQRGTFPALEGPEPVERGAIDFGAVFPLVPRR